MNQREKKTYRNAEMLLGQAFYVERRRKDDWRLDQVQRMCARALECKSEGSNQFDWVYIPPIKSNRTGFPAQ